ISPRSPQNPEEISKFSNPLDKVHSEPNLNKAEAKPQTPCLQRSLNHQVNLLLFVIPEGNPRFTRIRKTASGESITPENLRFSPLPLKALLQPCRKPADEQRV
ncbi:MAG TPA: hypothetical protein VFE22_04445, partial [Edaphobacter sp.]|nr:hypothetical protein [Edaphobacter sp.]